MAPYHVMLVHFPIALWTTAALIILLRACSDGRAARAADGALVFLLFLGALTGLLAFGVGMLVWPPEAAMSSPLARNHMLLAGWSLAYWIVLWLLRWRGGEQVWQGVWRWVMLGLAALGVGLQTITGTLGGYLAGNPSMVSGLLRGVGWEVFTTFYLPYWILALLILSSFAIIAFGVAGTRARTVGAGR
jgi:uncharacterized membrane protein